MIQALLAVLSVAPVATSFDLVIENARIVDGTGNPWYRADLGVEGERIGAIGKLTGAPAERRIDAAGRVVAPGFIDVHTHIEAGRTRDGIEQLPRAENFARDGVTTVVTGNCGSSRIRLSAWFDEIEALGLGINVASLVGHNSVRREVMGTDDRPPSGDELARMEQLVDAAMSDGAVGFSTGLLYVPGTYADTDEVLAMARVAARHGGIYASHIREQGARLHESIREAVQVGRDAGVPVQISHLKIKGRKHWGTIGAAFDLIDSLRRQGVDVGVDAYPYDRASTGLSVTLPAWALAGGPEALVARLEDETTRARIIEGMHELRESHGFADYSHARVARFSGSELEGMTITDIAAFLGRPATLAAQIETILELMSRGGASVVYHFMSEEDVETIYRYPGTAVASDGSVRARGAGKPHPRSYGTRARVFAEYVRRRGVITVEDAVRRMTSLPAGRFGLQRRGVLRTGAVADLVIFDPERVTDRATFDDPHRFSEGFDHVFVAGVSVVENGEPTNARPGRVLRHSGASE